MNITTSTGITVEINENAFDDMEIIDCIAELEDGNVFAISKLNNLLFGKMQKDKIYTHLKEQNDGKIPVAVYSAFIMEVMRGLNEGKKS